MAKQDLWHGGWTLVPRDVAVCPECGGQLSAQCEEWETETGRPTEWSGLSLDCLDENEATVQWEQDDSDDRRFGEVAHRWWQSDWQPVRDAVHKWAMGEE